MYEFVLLSGAGQLRTRLSDLKLFQIDLLLNDRDLQQKQNRNELKAASLRMQYCMGME